MTKKTEIINKEVIWKGVKKIMPVLISLGNGACKTCKKNPRRDGSAYCQKCSDDFRKENDKKIQK